ncbi:MAG TPA: hypothetical protein VFH50_06250 [Acidimicrobiales bacterium]|nr:hypothetical protein [Acidimicrobiales bacterium]
MSQRVLKAALAAGTAVSLSLAMAGVARAVSGGGYQPSQQDCTANAEANNSPQGYTQPGCHDAALNVESGGTSQGNASRGNTRYAEAGLNQEPQDRNSPGTPTEFSIGYPGGAASPHAGCVAANTDGTGGGTGKGCGNNAKGAGASATFDYYAIYCPLVATLGKPCEDKHYASSPLDLTPDTGTNTALDPILKDGLLVYFGMDDNNDNGEHDGASGSKACPNDVRTTCYDTDGAVNGPSDGGGITLSLTPQNLAQSGTAQHPEGLANASTGACADGICAEGTTQEQTLYHGCGANKDVTPKSGCSRKNSNVYDYSNDPSVNSESPNCNSGGPDTENNKACSSKGYTGMDSYRQGTASNVNAEPGVQIYSDPDPQRSPADPSIWPTPGIYAGTCGVSVNPGFLGQATDPLVPATSNLPGYDAADGQLLAVSPTGC